MLAQAVLTPSESKKLIASAVAKIEAVKQALKKGIVVMHPSSSTYFLVEAITGHKPKTNVWACGVVTPKGTCLELGPSCTANKEVSSTPPSIGSFRFSWVLKKGEFFSGITLDSLLEEMGPEDIYVKGVNALDSFNAVGVLIGNNLEAGTIGRVMAAHRKKGFKVIFPAGLEKLVPFSIKETAKKVDRKKCDYAMGIPCSLLPCEGIIVTELNAINILSGANAIPMAAGGIGGAEGAIILQISGDDKQVKEAIKFLEQAKGAKLPPVRTNNCYECGSKLCNFPVKDKTWV